jgi:two-component system phosphate regulon sensor histidine kinase PhoR
MLDDSIETVVYRELPTRRSLALVIPVEQLSGDCFLVIAGSLAPVDAPYDSVYAALFCGVLLLAVAAIVAARVLTDSLGRVATRASTVFRELGQGRMKTRFPLSYKGILQGLALDFNEMAEKIGSSFAAVSSEEEKSRHALMSMNEGVLVLDFDGTVLLANPAFERIAGGPAVSGTPWWRSFRDPALFDLFENVKKDRRTVKVELRLNGRDFLCTAEKLSGRDEVLFLFLDVALAKNIENIKRELVVSVSHELKTPLAAIKGFTETLQEDETDPRKNHFLEIISRNTERLIAIVTDLLDLGRLEERPDSLEPERLDFRGLVVKTVGGFSERASAKGLCLTVVPDTTAVHVLGDPYLLEQAVINLVDNSLRYSDRGGITVSVRADGPEAVLEVADNGIGIPENLQDRIFERFYVVDRSRSRQTGGTGLGLSIVKHIVRLHKGRITVSSRQGEGSTFVLRIPLAGGTS